MTTRPDLGTDQAHLMHPLHHPSAYAATRIWVSGKGAIITDAAGREYIDGLSGLWNVNIGHGRTELGDAAKSQMDTLAFHSAYAGGTNVKAIALAENGYFDERRLRSPGRCRLGCVISPEIAASDGISLRKAVAEGRLGSREGAAQALDMGNWSRCPATSDVGQRA